MQTKLIRPDSKTNVLSFPILMEYDFSKEYQESDVIEEKELVVLFTGETEGIVIHEKGTHHNVFDKSDRFCSVYSKHKCWAPFAGTIELRQ